MRLPERLRELCHGRVVFLEWIEFVRETIRDKLPYKSRELGHGREVREFFSHWRDA